MTDLPPPPPAAKPARWNKFVLGLSLAANLAVAGFVLGKALDGGAHGPRGMARDLAFGPFTQVLDGPDRRALAKSLFDRAPHLRDVRALMQADLDLIAELLVADPFDPVALDAALAAQNNRMAANLVLVQRALRDFLIAMDAEKRIAFGARLLAHRGGGPGERPAD